MGMSAPERFFRLGFNAAADVAQQHVGNDYGVGIGVGQEQEDAAWAAVEDKGSNAHFGRHAPELLGKLTAHDFTGGVIVTMQDGSCFAMTYGFARWEGDWLVLYTEHNGYHVLAKGSVEHVSGETR